MSDITYCTGKGCTKKERCIRWDDKQEKEYYFSIAPFRQKPDGQSCEHFKPKAQKNTYHL